MRIPVGPEEDKIPYEVPVEGEQACEDAYEAGDDHHDAKSGTENVVGLHIPVPQNAK